MYFHTLEFFAFIRANTKILSKNSIFMGFHRFRLIQQQQHIFPNIIIREWDEIQFLSCSFDTFRNHTFCILRIQIRWSGRRWRHNLCKLHTYIYIHIYAPLLQTPLLRTPYSHIKRHYIVKDNFIFAFCLGHTVNGKAKIDEGKIEVKA